MHIEADFNFGKMGLEYYLIAKLLWNPKLTLEELESIRISWLQRAFGSGWEPMQRYYDFLAPESEHVNAPNSWAKAIRLIEEADGKIDRRREPAAGLRLDDLKQYWYYYYLKETGEAKADSRTFREFVWKGQMSYSTAMQMVVSRHFETRRAAEAAGDEFNGGPAHYTPEETAQWWTKVLEHWPLTPVNEFAEAVLANGRRGAEVDRNDLVSIAEFQSDEPTAPFAYNSDSQRNAAFLSKATRAGEEIGFRLAWPFKAGERKSSELAVSYGISRWDAAEKRWEALVDETMASASSRETEGEDGSPWQLAELRYAAPEPGTYRIALGYAGSLARLGGLSTRVGARDTDQPPADEQGFTFHETLVGSSQGPVYLYIPKGMRHFDVEVWRANRIKLKFHTGLPTSGMHMTRSVEVNKVGTHPIELAPGEDGSLVMIESNGFSMPYCYSVPLLWAKSPGALLVPRAIAEADGLTPNP
jgi:hypothetical protein